MPGITRGSGFHRCAGRVREAASNSAARHARVPLRLQGATGPCLYKYVYCTFAAPSACRNSREVTRMSRRVGHGNVVVLPPTAHCLPIAGIGTSKPELHQHILTSRSGLIFRAEIARAADPSSSPTGITHCRPL